MDLHAENRGLIPREIRTDRLRLRPLTPADFDAIVTLAGDYDVSKMLVPVPHPYTRADAEEFYAMDQAGEVGALWMIDDGPGCVGAVSIGKELGYWLGKPAWGKGYMTEAAGAAVDAVMRHTDVPAIKSSHFVENTGSRRVLQKLGFQDTGPHVHFSNARQAEVAGRRMILNRADWVASNG